MSMTVEQGDRWAKAIEKKLSLRTWADVEHDGVTFYVAVPGRGELYAKVDAAMLAQCPADRLDAYVVDRAASPLQAMLRDMAKPSEPTGERAAAMGDPGARPQPVAQSVPAPAGARPAREARS